VEPQRFLLARLEHAVRDHLDKRQAKVKSIPKNIHFSSVRWFKIF
jgi:hypothetical protein